MRATQTLSYVSEGAIFLYVGMDTLDPLKWKARTGHALAGGINRKPVRGAVDSLVHGSGALLLVTLVGRNT